MAQRTTEKYTVTDIDVTQRLLALNRPLSRTPFLDLAANPRRFAEDIIEIQATALARRIAPTGSKTMVIGISGGADSTWAMVVASEAAKILGWKPSQIVGITMPGLGTSARTKGQAIDLMNAYGITQREIPIKKAVLQHFKDIGHDPKLYNETFENGQARERTKILFQVANQTNGIVVGTGDLSELCLGWCTFNGDHMSSYSVNSGIPKTMIQYLIKWYMENEATGELADVLKRIVETEFSPELLPTDAKGLIAQKTEDKIGPYELHDFYIYHHLLNGYSLEKVRVLAHLAFKEHYAADTIDKWLRVFAKRFYQQQFKRETLPPGPKIFPIDLSPRGGTRLPGDLMETPDTIRPYCSKVLL